MYRDVHVEVRGEAVQLVLSFHLYMASKSELTQVLRLGQKILYQLSSCWPSLLILS